MVTYAFNPSTWEAEQPCLEKQNKTNKNQKKKKKKKTHQSNSYIDFNFNCISKYYMNTTDNFENTKIHVCVTSVAT